MRNGHLVVLVGSLTAWILWGAAVSVAASTPIGAPIALGPSALTLEMRNNPEIAMMVERRGYPDWAERVEVDTNLPLDTYEIHLFYLRFDREVAFTRASFLGQPLIGIRRFERPMPPGMHERIVGYYLSANPARRAELAAAHAETAAESAERSAAVGSDAADNAEQIAAQARRSGYKRVTATKVR